MPVDVFGRQLGSKKKTFNRGPPGAGYKFTSSGDYDIDGKRLCNIAPPIKPFDAVKLFTLTQTLEQYREGDEKKTEKLLDDLQEEAVREKYSTIDFLEVKITEAKKNLEENGRAS